MMNSKDVVKALKCCSKYMDAGLCEECPLFGREDCGEKVLLDAAKTIEELEQQLAWERELMMELLKDNVALGKTMGGNVCAKSQKTTVEL